MSKSAQMHLGLFILGTGHHVAGWRLPDAEAGAENFPLITRMDMVRVIKGPGAVSFGPQTVGGAIDLVTRPIPTAGHGHAE